MINYRNFKIISLLIVFTAFISCKNRSNSKKESKQISNNKTEIITSNNSECPKIIFNKELDSIISLKGFYYECEDLWKQSIEFKFKKRTIYKTDSLKEYKFQDYLFPVLIRNGDLTEVILERDDRPLKNFLEVFKFNNSKLDSIYKIPYFETEPKDIDKDGIKEFYDTLEFVEVLGNGKIGYNPILVYEITRDKLTFDIEATKIVNENVYGKFYGLKIDETLEFNENEIEKNWP